MSAKRLPYDPARAARADVASRTSHGTKRHGVKNLEFPPVTSVSTESNYRSSMTTFATDQWTKRRIKLLNSTVEQGEKWLQGRKTVVGQKQLDQDRQALSNKFGRRLPYVRSEIPDLIKWRPYSPEQIDLLIQAATNELALSIVICPTAGLRSMELLTIGTTEDHEESPRDWPEHRFVGRETWISFIVRGKGNLFREIRLPPCIAAALEATRRPEPTRVRSREPEYVSHYDLVGGQRLSQQFTRLSMKVLGWSSGVHGLRHSFALGRFYELRQLQFDEAVAMKILAGEMGHFSIANTQGYLG